MQKTPIQNNAAEPETTPVVRFSRKNALWMFLLASAGLILTGFLSKRFVAYLPGDEHVRNLVVNLAFYLPFCVLPVLVSVRRKPEAAMCLRPNPVSLFDLIFISILAVLCVFLVNDIALIWSLPLEKLGLDVFKYEMDYPTSPAMLVLCVFTTAALPAICEELVFRGVVLPGFENYGSRYAVRMSALLFAMLHGSVVGLPGQYLLGITMAEIVIGTNSIYNGMIFHTVYNAALVMIGFMQRELTEELVAQTDVLGMIGGWEGLLIMVLEIFLIGSCLRSTLNIIYRRGRLVRGISVVKRKRCKFTMDEKLLLAAGLVMVAMLYLSDIKFMLQ